MATISTLVPIAVRVSDVAKDLPLRRRRITPEMGRALERLGHAIEYLMDEHFHEHPASTRIDRPDAVTILLELRRQVYMEAPEIEPLSEKLKQLLRMLLP